MSERTALEPSVSSLSPSRRSVLRAIGVAGGVSVLGGAASAKPGNGRGRPSGQEGGSNGADPKEACGTCTDGTYEKFDGAPKVGDEYALGGGTVTITDVMKKDDGEVYAFMYETVADIGKVCVKGGRPTQVYVSGEDFTGNGSGQWFYAPLNDRSPQEGDYYQVSNVAYCNSPGVTFQVDLVVGPAICQFDQDAGVTYSAQHRILNSTTFVLPESVANTASPVGCTGESSTSLAPYVDKDGCFTPDWAFFDVESDGKVSVRWQGTVDCDETIPLTLAVYRLPASGEIYPLDDQVLVACESIDVDASTTSLSIGDGDGSNDLYLYVSDGCSNVA